MQAYLVKIVVFKNNDSRSFSFRDLESETDTDEFEKVSQSPVEKKLDGSTLKVCKNNLQEQLLLR